MDKRPALEVNVRAFAGGGVHAAGGGGLAVEGMRARATGIRADAMAGAGGAMA